MTLPPDHSRTPADFVQAMPEELDRLLVQQIACVREGNLDRLEQIAARTEALVAGIASERLSGPPLTTAQKERLQRLYDEVTLALRAEQNEVQAKLNQLRQVKKALSAYGRQSGRQLSCERTLDGGSTCSS